MGAIIENNHMNIYALKGHRVRVSNLSGGYDSDKEFAKEHLEIGKEYIIESTSVSGWSTSVRLQEFPSKAFNSVYFEDVEPQSPEKDKQHKDYRNYNF